MDNLNKLAKKIGTILKRELVLLWFFALAAGFALIVFQNHHKLPLGKGDFVFLSILTLLVALYKPRWIFFLFVSNIALENIILASGFFPLQLRPYQFLGGILIVAIAILFASKQLKFKILKPTWIDWMIFSLVPFSFLALFHAPAKGVSLKNNLILFSFVMLYYLIRNFLRSRKDLLKTAFFFAGSYLVVLAYGFFQVLADKFLAFGQTGGAPSFEVMFGRPNATFTEADWLGIFLCFTLAVVLTVIFHFSREKKRTVRSTKFFLAAADIFLILNFILLILTLSRSAWAGAFAVSFFFLLSLMPKFGTEKAAKASGNWKKFAGKAALFLLLVLVSIAAVHFGKLSKFDIFDRARSTATSRQKITVACESGANIPENISSTEELAKFGCRFINLEEIESSKSQGKIVTEIFRKDPNAMTRSLVYEKSWEIIRQHPILGVGFGTITQSLGTDERGAGLNESNIFLQVWAGSGMLGLLAFVAVFGYLFVYSFRRVSPLCPMNKFIGCPIVKDDFEKTLHVFAVLAILALIIPNLFNAGLLMGLFWLGLAVIVTSYSWNMNN